MCVDGRVVAKGAAVAAEVPRALSTAAGSETATIRIDNFPGLWRRRRPFSTATARDPCMFWVDVKWSFLPFDNAPVLGPRRMARQR